MDQDSVRDPFPLHTAARLGYVAKAEALLEADPKLSWRKDYDGRYPIHWAASSNTLDIVVLLAKQDSFDPDVQDDSGWSPLMISASVPDSEPVLQILLQKGADVNEKNNSSQSALHFVASKKNLDVARLLLGAKPPASTRVRDNRGQYPIHRAAAVGSVPMIRLLLQSDSPINAADVEGFTPLHHAIAEGHGDAAVVLLEKGADFTVKNGDGELALDLAPDKEIRRFVLQGAEREGIDMSSS
ncbi:ankyrin repeat domain containing protein [Ophiocordyceps camponoti-floridani]|uniref:Ankyrin repeat domain containing protein n=1 Tax=Ophiocordyceps camponoti-floridani TaxID=2030778 RepID=A0A8H4QBM5_9HYPO|nr:ankyrin repeat domain containing protein [Ophiocordyceps camponoti-floridani]